MTGLDIINYRNGMEKDVVRLWNEVQPNDPISIDVFTRKVLLDVNFDRRGFLAAFSSGRMVGYAQLMVRRYPLLNEEDDNNGWVSALIATSEDIAEALLSKAEEYFSSLKRSKIWFSNYTPNYFLPGVDADMYPMLHSALLKSSFKETYEVFAMDAQLWPKLEHPGDIDQLESRLASEGVSIHELRNEEVVSLLEFIRGNFPPDWYLMSVDLLSRGVPYDSFIVATIGEDVVGYCQFWGNETVSWHVQGSHFGPFGVREDLRGKGIGTVLLKQCLTKMRSKGIHSAFFLWTDYKAARLYERFGFRITRRFKVMRRVI